MIGQKAFQFDAFGGLHFPQIGRGCGGDLGPIFITVLTLIVLGKL